MATAQPVADLAEGLGKSSITTADANKPRLVFCASPASGHFIPMERPAQDMLRRGFPLTFITGTEYESKVRAMGAEFVAIGPMHTAESIARRDAIPPGIKRLQHSMKHTFLDHMADRWEVLKTALARLRAVEPEREIIVVSETLFMGQNPLMLGVPLPEGFTERPRVINLHLIPSVVTSIDTGPFGPGFPPDSTESGRMRNGFISQMMLGGPFGEVLEYQDKLLKALGATKVPERNLPFHQWMVLPDLVLHLCPPSLEYERSDLPANIRTIGCLPAKPLPTDYKYPEWWSDVIRGDRRIVTVTQGTVSVDYAHLIEPTIQALADRDDVLVVAVLGVQGGKLSSSFDVPSNARIIEWLNYDAILPHTDVFVMNAGYGGFLQGVTNGTPMVLAGASENKPEVAMRGQHAGVAINLRTGQPTAEAIGSAVDRILADKSYRERVEEVCRENAGLNALDRLEHEIMEVLKKDV